MYIYFTRINRKLFLFLGLLLLFVVANAQPPRIDSLEKVLEKHIAMDAAKVDILNELAYAICTQDSDNAKSYALQSVRIADQVYYLKGKAAGLWILGLTSLRSDNKVALDYYRQALAIGEKVGDKVGICRYLLAIGSVMKDLGDIQESDESFERALKIAQELQNNTLIMKLLYETSRNWMYKGDSQRALATLKEVITLAKRVNDKQMLSTSYGLFASINRRQGNLVAALEYYLSALKIKEDLHDNFGIYYILVNMAGVQSEQNDLKSSLNTLKRALRISQERKDSLQMSTCLANMGNIHLLANEPAALACFQDALSLVKDNNVGLRINILQGIGTIHTDQGEFGQALVYFEEALALAREARLRPACGEVWVKLGVLYLNWMRYAEALDYANKACSLANELKITGLQRDCFKLLSDVYAATGTFDKAYSNHVQFKSLSDSLFNEKNIRKIAIMESSYKYEKEKQIYEKEKINHEMKIRNQRQIMSLLVITSILICMLACAIYWTNRLKKKVLRLEVEQMNRELETNQKTIAEATLKLVQNSGREANSVKLLENIKKNTFEEGQEEIRSLIADYKLKSYGSNWEEFEIMFKKVNASFYEKLNSQYPNLTPNERKLCVFLKLNMSNSHISQITYQSEEALKKARLRLRKKLGLERTVNLAAFIQSL